MASATATKTSYGWKVTGGTTTVTVFSGSVWVKAFQFIPATKNNAVVIRDKDGNSIYKINGISYAGHAENHYFGDKGTNYNGLIVHTLSNASDELHIVLA